MIYNVIKTAYLALIVTSIAHKFNEGFQYKTVQDYIRAGFWFGIFVVDTIEIIESRIQFKAVASILNDIEKRIQYLDVYENQSASFLDLVAKKFRKKFIICAIFFHFEFVLRVFSLKLTPFESPSILLPSFFVLHKQFAMLHAVLYIDMQSFSLLWLNDQLNPVQSNSANECFVVTIFKSKATQMLHRIKLLYLNIWRVSDNINQRFGCFLVAALVNSAFYFIRAGFSFFMALMTYNDIFDLLSELIYFILTLMQWKKRHK